MRKQILHSSLFILHYFSIMANYYSDHPEIGFYLNHPLMARIVELKEKGFAAP